MASQTVTISTTRAPGSSQSYGGFYIDTSDLKLLAKRLRAADPAAAKALRVRLREVGQVVADEAKSRASYSSRIPGSIRVGVSGVSVKVVAGGTAAPEAAPLENNGNAGTFRHPVFGTDTWVSQKARPFLAPAVDAKASEIEELALSVLDDTLKSIGL